MESCIRSDSDEKGIGSTLYNTRTQGDVKLIFRNFLISKINFWKRMKELVLLMLLILICIVKRNAIWWFCNWFHIISTLSFLSDDITPGWVFISYRETMIIFDSIRVERNTCFNVKPKSYPLKEFFTFG